MAIPSSGPLRLRADINQEINGNDTDTNVSLGTLSDAAGFDAPDTMSEFYGYSSITTPTVETLTPTSVTAGEMTLQGNITSDGGATVTTRGFYFGTNSDYTQNTKDTAGAGTGTYSKAESSLTPGQTYYVTAWAGNSVGEAVGTTVSQATTSCAVIGSNYLGMPVVNASSSSSIFVRLRYDESGLASACQPSSAGVYLGTSSNYSSNTKYTLWTGNAGDWGAYSNKDFTISSLNSNTTYYIREWVANVAGESVQTYNQSATTPLPTLPVSYGQGLVPYGDFGSPSFCPRGSFNGGFNFHYNTSPTHNLYVYGGSMFSHTNGQSPPCKSASGNISGGQWRYLGQSFQGGTCSNNAQAGGTYTGYGAVQASGYADNTRSYTQNCSN